jgi:hypothetical protein
MDGMSTTERRAEREAQNQALFKQVNERIHDVLESLGDDGRPGEFVCECGCVDCATMMRLTQEEYEAAREGGERFIVVPGHEQSGLDRIYARHEGFFVVETVSGAKEMPGPNGRAGSV